MRLIRTSLRISTRSALAAAYTALVFAGGAACGGGGGAGGGGGQPAPTAAQNTAVPAVSAPSPQRPALASPAPSPSATSATTTGATTTTAAPTSATSEASSDYEVQSGDTLAIIADHFYGDGTTWRRIYDANKDTIGADPDKLKIGMKLKIPPKQ